MNSKSWKTFVVAFQHKCGESNNNKKVFSFFFFLVDSKDLRSKRSPWGPSFVSEFLTDKFTMLSEDKTDTQASLIVERVEAIELFILVLKKTKCPWVKAKYVGKTLKREIFCLFQYMSFLIILSFIFFFSFPSLPPPSPLLFRVWIFAMLVFFLAFFFLPKKIQKKAWTKIFSVKTSFLVH